MPTVYIAPTAQGSANGTSEANAYAFSSIDTAESDAGDGGTILFLDGNYNVGSSYTFEPGSTNSITYKSLNKHKAVLTDQTSSDSAVIRLGSTAGTSGDVIFEDFKVTSAAQFLSQTQTTIKGIFYISSAGFDPYYGFFYRNGGDLTVETSAFIYTLTGGGSFAGTSSGITINNSSFYLDCSALSANAVNSNSFPATNTIFSSNNATAVATNLWDPSNKTNCCFHNSNHTSGGTNNIFADPLFVDPASDLRLRPSSPCIGAGSAS